MIHAFSKRYICAHTAIDAWIFVVSHDVLALIAFDATSACDFRRNLLKLNMFVRFQRKSKQSASIKRNYDTDRDCESDKKQIQRGYTGKLPTSYVNILVFLDQRYDNCFVELMYGHRYSLITRVIAPSFRSFYERGCNVFRSQIDKTTFVLIFSIDFNKK